MTTPPPPKKATEFDQADAFILLADMQTRFRTHIGLQYLWHYLEMPYYFFTLADIAYFYQAYLSEGILFPDWFMQKYDVAAWLHVLAIR